MALKLHTYKCREGHDYQDYGPFEVAMVHQVSGRITSGPICPMCFVAWVRDNVPEVVEEVEEAAQTTVTIDPRKEPTHGTKRVRKHSE